MYLDIFIDEFKARFKPTFKEEDMKTYCAQEEEAILYKDEVTQEYVWLKEYPQEIKGFILKTITPLLPPKLLLSDYYPRDNQVKALDGFEIKEFVVSNHPYLQTLIFLDVEVIRLNALRQLSGGYILIPIFNIEDKGLKKEAQLGFITKALYFFKPSILSKNLIEKFIPEIVPQNPPKD